MNLKISTAVTVLPREDVLFCECAKCGTAIVWRSHAKVIMFSGSCCGMVYSAAPKDSYLRMFVISMLPVNMENVRILSEVS